MKEIRTSIDIAATAERVWQVLTQLQDYPRWNPFIPEASGELRVGGRLQIVIAPPGKKPMNFAPKILACDEGKEFRWIGRMLMPGIFDGEHRFVIEAREGGVRLLHGEKFSGLLIPFFWPGMGAEIRSGFEAMNIALKAEAEAEVSA